MEVSISHAHFFYQSVPLIFFFVLEKTQKDCELGIDFTVFKAGQIYGI